MSEATQTQGADLQSAANAIESLLGGSDNQKKQPEKESPQESEELPLAASSEEPDEQPQEREDEPDSEGEAQEEEDFPSYLDQFAEKMKLDAAKLHNLKVKTKIDGQEGEATLADLIKSYQLEGHLNKKSMAFAEQQKQFDQQVQEYNQRLFEEFKRINTYTQMLETELVRDFRSVNWDELRLTDPAEYSAKAIDFDNRMRQINEFTQMVNKKFQEESEKALRVNKEKEEEFRNFLTNTIKQEQEALISKIPEWKDPAKKSAGQQKLRSYLKSHGFTDEDLNSVIDHRHIVIADKARRYDELARSKSEVMKKAQTLPTYIKQSGTKSKADIQAEKYQSKFNKLKKTGKMQDAASLIAEML
jgi:hypothetical protein